MPIIDLPHGRVQYRLAGPGGVADELSGRGMRSFALDLPLGSHSLALRPDADLSPREVRCASSLSILTTLVSAGWC